MLTDQSKRNVEAAFRKAAQASLLRQTGDECAITPAPGNWAGCKLSANVLLITISSFVFRLLTIMQFAENAATRAYYVKGSADSRRDDEFAEVANMCCGAFSRELSHNFPHLAMSIPYILNSQCSAFLGDLRPQYLSSYAITINNEVQLQATLCMCCSGPVLVAASTAEAADHGGELELF